MKDKYSGPTLVVAVLLLGFASSQAATTKKPATTTLKPTTTTVVIPTKCPIIDEGDTVHLAHECNCGLFYKCSHGKKFLQECPEGLFFNPVLQVCDYPIHVNCTTTCPKPTTTQKPTTSKPATTTTKATTSSSLDVLAESSEDKCGNGKCENEVQEVDLGPASCIGSCIETDRDNQLYLPNLDCSKYCVCDEGRLVVLSCPPNMHFNAARNTCDFPEVARCEGLIREMKQPSKMGLLRSAIQFLL